MIKPLEGTHVTRVDSSHVPRLSPPPARHRRGQGRRNLVVSLSATLSLLAPVATSEAVEVRTNAAVRHQTVEGWGTHIGAANTQTLNAYRDLGMNIMRMNMPKEVLVAPGGDFRTRVPLGPNLNDNVAKMRFDTSDTAGFGQTARWLKQNALEPDRVKIIADVWSPPHWMKGPTGASAQWVGNPSSDSPSFATPWLSNQYNHWYNNGANAGNPANNNGPTNPHFHSYSGDSIGGRLRTEDATNLQEYGRYMAAWVTGFERQHGVKIDNVSLQNESTFENPFDSMTFIKDQNGNNDFTQYAKGLKAVRDAFAAQGVTTKIRGPHVAHLGATPANPFGIWWQEEMIEGVKNHSDPTLKDALSMYTSNYYMGTSENDVKMTAAYWRGKNAVPGAWAGWADVPGYKQDGKANWFVETGDGNGQWMNGPGGTPGDGAITVALKLHNALVHADAAAYLYWQFTDGDANPSTYNLLGTSQVSNPHASKKYDAFKQFSRFVRPGAVRIDATFADTGKSSTGGASEFDTLNSLNVSAFVHDQDRTATIVLVNMEAASQFVNIDVPMSELIGSYDVYLTNASSDFAQLADLFVVNGEVSVTVPQFSVLTLHGIAPVPEPAGLALLAVAATGAGLLRPRRCRPTAR